MLKYEEKLGFDKQYEKLKEGKSVKTAMVLLSVLICYPLLELLIRYGLSYISDINPWDETGALFNILGTYFLIADVFYIVMGGILLTLGIIRIVKTTELVHSTKELLTEGIYAKVRHPMYGAFILMQAGFLLSLRSLIGLLIALLVILAQYINAYFEEKRTLIPMYGDSYEKYKKNTKKSVLTTIELLLLILFIGVSVIGFNY